jgi:hypothetical protein
VSALSRRTFLIGSATGSALLAACGRSTSSGPSQSTSATALAFLVPAFPDGFSQAATLVPGVEQRLPFVLRDQIDVVRDNAPARLAMAIQRAGETIHEATIEAYSDGIFTPYYPLMVTLPEPGQYEAVLTDHPDVAPVSFLVVEPGTVTIAQVGDPLPNLDTPTVDAPRGVNPICTRALPCSLHDKSLREVVSNGRPTVLLIATPGFCQTDICGPVVDLVQDVAGARSDLDVIHAEVYVDPSVFTTGAFPEVTPIVSALSLPYEPALFVADGDGIIVARVDTTFDRRELADALTRLS